MFESSGGRRAGLDGMCRSRCGFLTSELGGFDWHFYTLEEIKVGT